MTDQSSQIQGRAANISALLAWPLYTTTLALTATSLSSSGKLWQWNCNTTNGFLKTLQVSRDIRAFDTLYIFGKLHIILFKQHLTCDQSFQGYSQLSPHRGSEVWCHINTCHELTDWTHNRKDSFANSKNYIEERNNEGKDFWTKKWRRRVVRALQLGRRSPCVCRARLWPQAPAGTRKYGTMRCRFRIKPNFVLMLMMIGKTSRQLPRDQRGFVFQR